MTTDAEMETGGSASSDARPGPAGANVSANMRCRPQNKVPKCFRYVKCPYPQAQTCNGVYGAINYSLVGPEDGEVIICFHGLNGSRILYQDVGNMLAKEGGYRVLSFDLYGHGLSNAPKVDLYPCECCRGCTACGTPPRGRYDLDFFVDQTDELLEKLGLGDQPVNLIGFSLGGAICVAFAKAFPDRVRRIVLMSPAGFLAKVPKVWYLLQCCWCWLIPLAPHVLCTCWYKRERFARSLKQEDAEVDDEVIDNLWSRFVWQLYVKRGVASATLAVLHQVNWFNLRSLYREVGKHSRPVLLIWGERDTLNPVATTAQEVKEFFSNVQLHVVRNAAHIALCDQPRPVLRAIMAFLSLPPDGRADSVQLGTNSVGRRSRPSAPKASAARPERPSSDAGNDGTGSKDSLGASAAKADRVCQMPVPIILGHHEDIDDSPTTGETPDDLSREAQARAGHAGG
mmetsp:Transcript_22190/g.41289  ORF Transcript_22190/g.41289 Transcript_22190/m.41289 type:complete len:456 (-) Transcript_22190:112-1479(-)